MLNLIGRARISLFVFVSVLLCFYMSWKSFKSGNTVNTEYLNRISNTEYLTGANVPKKNVVMEVKYFFNRLSDLFFY